MMTIPQPFGGLIIPRSRGAPAPALVYRESRVVTNDAQIYTFNDVSFGTPGANRYIIVAAHNSNDGGRSMSSVTIGGVTASEAVFSDANSVTGVGIYIAPVPTGTSGTIVLTYIAGSAQDRCAIGVWAVYDLLSATPVDTDVGILATSNSLSLSNLPANSVIIGAITSRNNPTFSWSTLTQDYTDGWSDTSGNNQRFAGASHLFTAGGNLNVTVGSSNGLDTNAVIAAFR